MNKQQIKLFYALTKHLGDEERKHLVASFSSSGSESKKDLGVDDAQKLIKYLQSLNPTQKPEGEQRKILKKLKYLGVELSGQAGAKTVDWDRVKKSIEGATKTSWSEIVKADNKTVIKYIHQAEKLVHWRNEQKAKEALNELLTVINNTLKTDNL
jgi:hypothetical protein